jgi:hypothetical protein
MSYSAIIGVSRIERLPDPNVPSVEVPCAECHAPCWLSVAMRAPVIAIEGTLPPLICEVCMPGRLAGVSRS